jgi:hypothetical protein
MGIGFGFTIRAGSAPNQSISRIQRGDGDSHYYHICVGEAQYSGSRLGAERGGEFSPVKWALGTAGDFVQVSPKGPKMRMSGAFDDSVICTPTILSGSLRWDAASSRRRVKKL